MPAIHHDVRPRHIGPRVRGQQQKRPIFGQHGGALLFIQAIEQRFGAIGVYGLARALRYAQPF